MVDLLYEYYIEYCPLFQSYLIYIAVWNFPLLPSSGDWSSKNLEVVLRFYFLILVAMVEMESSS
jgi:hypothetical protein